MFNNAAFVMAVVVLMSMSTNAKATPAISATSPLPWVRITTANDSDFGALAKAAVGREDITNIADVLPYSVVITNRGATSLVGVAVRFRITQADKKVVTRDFFYYSFPPAKPMFAQGDSHLITPLRSANSPTSGAQGARSASEGRTLADLAAALEINASIDLIIAQDGCTAGPDVAHTVQQIVSQAQANHDMNREALARLDTNTDAEVMQWLRAVQAQPVASQRVGEITDRYVSMQRTLSDIWLKLLSSGKRDALRSQLILTTSATDATFTFLKSLHGGLQ